jgi:hypothetical protein
MTLNALCPGIPLREKSKALPGAKQPCRSQPQGLQKLFSGHLTGHILPYLFSHYGYPKSFSYLAKAIPHLPNPPSRFRIMSSTEIPALSSCNLLI